MTDDQLKDRLKQILATPVLTTELINELHVLLQPPKKAKSATKTATKQASNSNDRKTISSLKLQIENLKSQLSNPKKASNDDLIDQLYIKTIQRTHEIESKGQTVTFNTSERQHKALKVSENTYHFTPGTPLTIGTEVKSATGSDCIITAIRQVAGRIEATTFNPDTTCQSYTETKTATGNNLSKHGTSISCKLDKDRLTTFNHRYAANTVLKLADTFYIVEGSYLDGLLATHKLKLYEGLKSVTPMQGDRRAVDNSNLPRNFSMYDSQIM